MKLTLSYQPLELLPPFAYAAVFKIEVEDEAISALLDIEYLGREHVSDDELKAEGFTKNDDFSWSGELDARWKHDLVYFENQDTQSEPDEHTYLHIHVNGVDKGFPKHVGETEMRFQELMQAVLETSEIESPLEAEVLVGNIHYALQWSFQKRQISINKLSSYNWEVGRDLMSILFNRDFESLKPSKKATANTINPGDGFWYPIEDTKSINSISRLVNQLTS